MSIVKKKQKNGDGLRILMYFLYLGCSSMFGAIVFPMIAAHFGKEDVPKKYCFIAIGVCFFVIVLLESVPVVTEIFHGILGASMGFVLSMAVVDFANSILEKRNLPVWEENSVQSIVIYIIGIALVTYFFVRYAVIERRTEKEKEMQKKALENPENKG